MGDTCTPSVGTRQPYKLSDDVRGAVLEALRAGLTMVEAAALVAVSPSAIYRFCRANSPEAQTFSAEIERARTDGQPYRGSSPKIATTAQLSVSTDTRVPRSVMEVMGLRVEPARDAVQLYEAAFLLAVSVNQLRRLLRQEDTAASSTVVTMLGNNRRRIRIGWLLERPEVAQRPIAAVLAARLIEGRLEVPRPTSDSAIPLSHIVVLAQLL
jgi:hypothetical protein